MEEEPSDLERGVSIKNLRKVYKVGTFPVSLRRFLVASMIFSNNPIVSRLLESRSCQGMKTLIQRHFKLISIWILRAEFGMYVPSLFNLKIHAES